MRTKFIINRFSAIILWLFVTLSYTSALSQDLEPRLLSDMPTGANIAIASYSHSAGNILVDNALPIEDLDASLNNFVFGYAKSFKLFNKLTKFDVIVPISLGKYNAIVEGEETNVNRNGFGDPLFRISMILVGATPLKPQDYFKQEPKKFKLGFIFRFKAPLGSYNSENLLNVGTNRWSFQTGLGASYTIKKKIIFEGHLNTWLFTENNDFFGGNTSQQKPLLATQIHAAYVFKPGIWLAVSTGKTFGGELEVNGIENDVPQKNSRAGAAFGYKLNKHSGLKLAYTNGFSTRVGADFNSVILVYTYIWFDKK